MSPIPLATLVRRITPGQDTVSDADLLDRFIRAADQAAFELLVWRHGAMVWGVCRRVLDPDRDAAEDACQAAFVALALHAARLRARDSLAAWLHRVAVRASLDLNRVRRATRSLPVDHPDPPARDSEPFCQASDREVRSLLDTGLNGLPDKLRLPFVLCELEGRSNAEAAAALGCPVGTVESRLTRARQRLREWLTARGVVPALAIAAVAVPESARAAMVHAASNPTTLSAAVRTLAARAIPSVVSAKARALAAASVVLFACAVGFGVTLTEEKKPSDPPPMKTARPPAPEAKEADGVPLPAGAVARLGSPHLRHGGWVYDLRFSTDGKRLASVGSDNTVRVWDAATGKQLFVVRRKEGGFNRVAFAPDGKTIVAVGHSPQMVADLWLIDAATGKVTAEKNLPGRVSVRNADPAVRFSPDGSRLAVGTPHSNELLVFDTARIETLWSAKLKDETAGGVCFSPDGKMVAVSTNKGKVRLYDAAGKPAEVLAAEAQGLTNVAISPDGKMVVAATDNGTVAWERDSGKVLWKRQTRAEYSLAFTADGKAIVCSAYGFRACTLDPADGYGGGISGKPGAYFDWMVEATASAFRPDGSAVAFGTISGTICQFDPKEGKLVAPSADPPHEVRWARFSPDGKTLHGWSADWFAWDVATGKQSRVTRTGWNYGEPLSPDGKYTARSVWYTGERPAGSTDDGTRFEIRNAKTGEVVHSHPGKAFQGIAWKDFTLDGKAIIGGLPDGTLRAWAIDTGKELFKLPGHKAGSQYHAFSADGRVLVTGAFGDGEAFPVRLYDLKAGKELAKFSPGLWVVGVAVSGDGRRVAAATSANARGMKDPREVAVVWDVESGKVLARVPQLREGKFVALSPDGRLLAIAPAWEGDIRVHEVASGAERFAFRHDGQPTDLLFSTDGRMLVAASKEAPIYLWDVAGELAGKPAAWEGAGDKVWDDLASKDAARAFAAIRTLRANPEKAIALLKERTTLAALPENLKQLVADLGSEDFATREKAMEALAALGEAARSALETALGAATNPEAKKRLGELLVRLDAATTARFRLVRAVEAVEGIDTPEAKSLLETWASGAGPLLAAEAKIALLRRAK
jgi:RNA polymerase sigma factor (sigma-70 family)